MDAGCGWGGGGGEGRGAGGAEGNGWDEQSGKPTFIRSLDLFNSTLSLEWYWRGPRSQEVEGGGGRGGGGGGGVTIPNKSFISEAPMGVHEASMKEHLTNFTVFIDATVNIKMQMHT